MTGKERILAAMDLANQKGLPAAIYGGGMFTLRQAGETFDSLAEDPERMAEVLIRMAEEIGNPMVYCGSGYNNFHVAALGGKIKFRKQGAPDLEEPLVSDLAGLRGLDMGGLSDHKTIQTVWETTEMVSRAIGDRFVVTTTSWGPFTLAGQIFGVERLMRSTFRDKELVREVIDFAAEFILRFYEPLVKNGSIPIIALADPTASGDLLSRKQFAEFALPPLQHVTERVREMGGRSLLHICGDTSDRLDLLADSGAEIVSIDHKVDLGAAREAFRGKTCLAGNINPVTIMLQGTVAEVVAATEKAAGIVGPGGGAILMPGCDIPPTVPRENVEAFLATAARLSV